MAVENPIRVGVRTGRRWRGPVVLLVLLAFLGAATVFGYRALRENAQSPATGATICTPQGGSLNARDVKLRVLNSTVRPGLGGQTGTLLRSRGFDVVKVGNYPGGTVRGVAVIRGTKKAAARMKLVRTQVPGATLQYDKRRTATVDLILGRRYVTLAPVATKAPGAC